MVRYHLMRQDDNGNSFFVACRDSKEAADCIRVQLEAGGHKQTYWVEPSLTCTCRPR